MDKQITHKFRILVHNKSVVQWPAALVSKNNSRTDVSVVPDRALSKGVQSHMYIDRETPTQTLTPHTVRQPAGLSGNSGSGNLRGYCVIRGLATCRVIGLFGVWQPTGLLCYSGSCKLRGYRVIRSLANSWVIELLEVLQPTGLLSYWKSCNLRGYWVIRGLATCGVRGYWVIRGFASKCL
jgi:hypothetical protein